MPNRAVSREQLFAVARAARALRHALRTGAAVGSLARGAARGDPDRRDRGPAARAVGTRRRSGTCVNAPAPRARSQLHDGRRGLRPRRRYSAALRRRPRGAHRRGGRVLQAPLPRRGRPRSRAEPRHLARLRANAAQFRGVTVSHAAASAAPERLFVVVSVAGAGCASRGARSEAAAPSAPARAIPAAPRKTAE